jgi:hypothetical protein
MESLSAQLPHFGRAVPAGVRPDAVLGNRRDIPRADIPAVGTVSARAVAKMYAALLGEVDGVRLVSPERLRQVSEVAAQGPDWTFGADVSRTLGYGSELDGAMFGSGGIGGSLAGAALAQGMAICATRASSRSVTATRWSSCAASSSTRSPPKADHPGSPRPFPI